MTSAHTPGKTGLPISENPFLNPRLRTSGKAVKVTRSLDSAAKLTAQPSKAKVQLPAGFISKSDGYYFNPKGENTTPFRVCSLFSIIAETRSVNNNNWGSVFEWKDHDGHVHRSAIPKALLASDGAEMRRLFLDQGMDIEITQQARGKFSELIAGMRTDVRALAIDTLGWTGSAFVLPNRTIGDSADHLVIYQGTDALDHPYRTRGTLEAWHANVARFAVGNSRVVISLAAALVGPCLSLLGEEGGGFHFRGPSSIGKSTALFVAASAWGTEQFVRPWRATTNGLEAACVQHNETLLCLDEIAQLDPRDAGAAAYVIGNGKGKARADRSGLLRSSAMWTVLFLSSGEISLSEHAGRDARGAKRSAAGQDVRICDIPADAGAGFGLFENLHDAPNAETLARWLKNGTRETYGIAGPAFVECLVKNVDDATADLKEMIQTFVVDNVPKNAGGQVARVARRFAMVAAVGELAVQFGILPWPPGEATGACAQVLSDWLLSRGGVGSQEDRDAVAKVRGYLEMHGSSRFEAIDADDSARIINRAGFWREGDGCREFLFLPETWKTEVCAGMDSSRVAKTLAEHGYLSRDSAGKNSVSVTLPAGIGKARCYVVNSRIFDTDEPQGLPC